ncbi:MAG: hypothetical protein Q9225_005382 [Loekoesia sp. 1 TL-2023]
MDSNAQRSTATLIPRCASRNALDSLEPAVINLGNENDYDFIRFVSDPEFEARFPPRPQPQPDPPVHIPPPTPAEQDIIDACANGDLTAVERFLEDRGWKDHAPDNLHVYRMVLAAISHKRASIVNLLLDASPEQDFNGTRILFAALENPDLDTFKAIHSHNPNIVRYEYNQYQCDNPLVDACRCGGGDPSIPKFLLDHGADPNEGGLLKSGAFYDAVYHGQPLWIIQNMVERGAVISSLMTGLAIQLQRVDVVRYFLENSLFDTSDNLTELAREKGNEEIIRLVEHRSKHLTRKEKKIKADMQKKTKTTKGSKRLWQVWK